MRKPWWAVLLIFLMTACIDGGIPQAAEQTRDPETLDQTQIVATSIATDDQPTAEATSQTGCPPAPGEAPAPIFDAPLEAGEALLQYLNAGGEIEGLRDFSQAHQVINPFGVATGLALPDLNGDGIPEVLLSLIDSNHPLQQGRIYIASCSQGRYSIAYQTDFSYPSVLISSTSDLTGDGLDDLLLIREACGAHTCTSWVEVVGWKAGTLQNLMEQTTFDLPSTSIELVGPTASGSTQIVMTGNGVASVGAGPYHQQSVTWGWRPDIELFQPGELEYLPSTWRIHVVHDADRAYAAGDYLRALELFDQAIRDESLQDWPSGQSDGDRALELAAYARFRSMLAFLKLDNAASAESLYEQLLAFHPPDGAGAMFASMGEAFWEQFSTSGSISQSCLAAQPMVQMPEVGEFGPLDYGYSNPTYSPADMCPGDR